MPEIEGTGDTRSDNQTSTASPTEVIAEEETRLFRTAEILSKALNLDYQRYLKFAYVYGCLSAA